MNGLSFLRSGFLCAVFLACLAGATADAKSKMLDLTDTVLSNRIMTKFALVVRGSNLASFLSSRGPFTLFAPTDSAFSKLPPGELEALLRPENQEALQRILLFHLVNGNRYSAKDLLKQTKLPSCEGSPIPIRTSKSGAQFVDKARILHADVRCLNGLMHEIDTVLIPPGLVLPPPVTAETPAAGAAPDAPGATNADQTPAPALMPTSPNATNGAPEPASTNTSGAPAGTNAAPAGGPMTPGASGP